MNPVFAQNFNPPFFVFEDGLWNAQSDSPEYWTNLVKETGFDDAYGDRSCKMYSDFRDLLARKEIDAVQISTPDHWHVHMAIMALQAGKDVSCEKPTCTIGLGRKLVNAIGKTDRIYAISLEDRSLDPYYGMAMLVRNGYIGKITKMGTG